MNEVKITKAADNTITGPTDISDTIGQIVSVEAKNTPEKKQRIIYKPRPIIRKFARVGPARNQPCSCGSEIKYKYCCGKAK